MELARTFQYQGGELHCEEVPLSRIGREVGTPCYVYSRAAVLHNFRLFQEIFREVQAHTFFAVKANSNLAILRLLAAEGSGFDIVSEGEFYRLQRIGVPPEKVIFSGVGKTASELKLALQHSIFCINLESLEELEQLCALSRNLNRQPRVALRLNPDVSAETHPYISTGLRQHKFGIDLEQAGRAQEILLQNPQVQLTGLGFHIGSQILDVRPFMDAFVKFQEVVRDFSSRGFVLRHLDLGGGFGIPYRGEKPPDLPAYARFLARHRGEQELVFEPGRFIVGNAGILLNQVLYRKVNEGKHFVVVDGAMNDLLRPSLYQAYHEIQAVREAPPSVTADVVGPVCETGDFFARDRLIPSFDRGDYLAVMNAGAYGFVLSSNYNSRPRAAEVLVSGKEYRIIRLRESLEDLIRGEA